MIIYILIAITQFTDLSNTCFVFHCWNMDEMYINIQFQLKFYNLAKIWKVGVDTVLSIHTGLPYINFTQIYIYIMI